ncbi:MAG: hypothetical protein ACRCST_17595, partial [Turicibacter sp.]
PFALHPGGESIFDVPNDRYLYWGTEENPPREQNGIEITIQKPSTSHSMVDIVVKVDWDAMQGIDIDKFYLLANNKIVDEFYPRYDTDSNGKLVMSGYYSIKPMNSVFIGSSINFQVVAVNIDDNPSDIWGQKDIYTQKGVLWSQVDGPHTFKPLPVTDKETHSLLEDILALLRKMLTEIADLLKKLSKQIETLFTPSEKAKKELEDALKDFADKLPMNQIKDQLDDMKDVMENTPLKPPGSDLIFGDSKDYFQIGIEFHLWDFTLMKEYIKPFRDLMVAFMWLGFFNFLIAWLLPRLDL